jgi:uncharacterized protein (TIGR02217 family)
MATFLSTVIFPNDIAEHSKMIPKYMTDIITAASGFENRDDIWTYPRNAYDIGYGIRNINDIADLLAYFHSVHGRAYGFRFRDWSDYKSVNTNQSISDTDVMIGTGDDSEDKFQVVKKYTKGALTQTRKITRLPWEQYYGDLPPDSQVTVSLDDVHQTYETDWDYVRSTGIIDFVTPPSNGVIVKCGFEFYVPVRFDTDILDISLDDFNQGSISVPLIELRE